MAIVLWALVCVSLVTMTSQSCRELDCKACMRNSKCSPSIGMDDDYLCADDSEMDEREILYLLQSIEDCDELLGKQSIKDHKDLLGNSCFHAVW